jgi:hypothetical protein
LPLNETHPVLRWSAIEPTAQEQPAQFVFPFSTDFVEPDSELSMTLALSQHRPQR